MTLNDGARYVVRDWMCVKPSESALVLTDEIHTAEAFALYDECLAVGAVANIIVMPSKTPLHGEPGALVDAAFMNADVIIAASHYSVATTKLRERATEKGARFVSLPMATSDGSSILLRRFIQADARRIVKEAQRAYEILDAGEFVHITTDAGTDLYMDVRGRNAILFSSIGETRGVTASASIELYTPPVESFTHGKLFVDASLGYLGKVTSPFWVTFENGRVRDIEKTEDGARLSDFIAAYNDNNMYVVCELGIGLNDLGECIGHSYVEDESCYKTFHLGFGRNTSMGGQQHAIGHFDIVINAPTITVDDQTIMKDGIIIV